MTFFSRSLISAQFYTQTTTKLDLSTGNIQGLISSLFFSHSAVWRQTTYKYSPYSQIRHIETVTRQPLQISHRAYNCWCFFLVINSMSLYSIWNIAIQLITLYQHNCRLLILASAQTCLFCPDRLTSETKAFYHNVK